MRKNILIVVVILLASALSPVAVAAGDGLTAKQVRKLAAKVVDRKAHGLTVRYARTAADAVTVDGFFAAQLQTHASRYTLSAATPAPSRTWAFDWQPEGSYLVTFDVAADMSVAGANLVCQLQGVAAPASAEATGSVWQSTSRVTGTLIVTKTVAQDPHLTCTATSGSFTLSAAHDNALSLVWLDDVHTNAAHLVP